MLRAGYQKLSEDAEVQAALKTVEGSLAESPEVAEAATDTPEQPVSLPADEAAAPQDNIASTDEPAPAADSGNESPAEETPQEPVANYDELKRQLTDLEKATKLALGNFNKGAKAYLKTKKELVKRIKAGEALIAKRSKFQDSLPDGEQKTKFGQETEAKVIGPLNELKSRLQSLRQPDSAPLEDHFKQAEKLVKQVKTTTEYGANAGSIDGLAEKIAKYHRGFEVQKTKMAK